MGVAQSTGSLAIEQLAAVIAAQGDDFDLGEILELEGVDEAAWNSAKQTWLPKIATDDALREQYDASLTEAQERLGRSVSPIESDLAAWVAFLGECEKQSTEQVAETHGLTLNDFARLQRKWQERFEGDDELAGKAKELRAKLEADEAIVDALVVTAEERPLTPSPYATGASKEVAVALPAATEETPSADVPPLSLDKLAAILIEFSFGVELAETFASHGFASAETAQRTLLAWQQQLDADPDAQDALQEVLDRQRNQPASASASATPPLAIPAAVDTGNLQSPWQPQSAQQTPATAPRAPSIDGTSEAIRAFNLPPLPFDDTGTFQPITLSDEEVAAARTAPNAGATAFATPAVEVPLPFDAAPNQSIDETALAIPVLQLDDALPFEATIDDETTGARAGPLDRTAGLDSQLLAIDELPFGNNPQSVDATGFIDTNLMHLDEMPFDDAPSPIAAARPASKVAEARLQPHQARPGEVSPTLGALSETGAVDALSLSQLAHIPLPFASPPSQAAAPASAPPGAASAPPPARRAKASTFIGRLPSLTVDQYACYVAERDLYPTHLEDVRQRYGVVSEDGHGVMALRWAARLAAHPEQRQRYTEAYQQYLDWLQTHR